MNETLKMMKSILLGYERELTFNKLLNEYQQQFRPNYLAYMFVDNYGVIYQTSQCYSMLTDEDKSSFCLQELDKCLHSFDITKQVKFITYFLTCYKNRLRTETEKLFLNTNRVNHITNNIDDYRDILQYTDNYDILDLKNYNLSASQILQCDLIEKGYSFKEIAKLLGVSVQYIYQQNKNISKKIQGLL